MQVVTMTLDLVGQKEHHTDLCLDVGSKKVVSLPGLQAARSVRSISAIPQAFCVSSLVPLCVYLPALSFN